MRTATSLALIAIGAIFTFAVSAHPSFLNLQIAGVVIMATGIAGLFLRKPTQGWLRRRTTLRRGGGGPVVGHVDEKRYPPYIMLNPAANPEQAESNGHQPGDLTADETAEPEPSNEPAPIPEVPAEDLAEYPAYPAEPQGAEVVEEYIQE
jgi:hypothetical protein